MTRPRAAAANAFSERATARAAPAAPPLDEVRDLAGDPNFMTSLARGLAVIRAFSQQRQRLSIAQISLRTGISRAAVRRCLYTLGRLGYVGSDDGRNFALRPRILALGHAYLSSAPLATSAQPLLDQVSAAVHESCSMAILDGDDLVYVARSSSSARIMSIDLGVGSRLPAFCTSMGRVLLGALTAPELNEFLKRLAAKPYTNRTIVAKDKLRDLIAAAREAGFAVVDQELEIGLRSIAVPVLDARGRPACAINVSTQAARVPAADMERRFLPALRTAAADLSLLLM
ncbi:MAG TPA: IclR family transcriptional regulator C-terminal domain-containing protein [Casimicrobiaceae bacterium]